MSSETLIQNTLQEIVKITNKIKQNFIKQTIECSLLEETISLLKILKTNLNDEAISAGNSLFNQILTDELLSIFRFYLSFEEKTVRKLTLKVIRYLINVTSNKTSSFFFGIIKKNLLHIMFSKIFEDYKYSSYEERLEAYRIIMTWLELSPSNFPLLISQGIASFVKIQDEHFKKASLEFIRDLAVKLPDQCRVVGGYKILISTLLDGNYLDYSEFIFNTVVFLINSPHHRLYLRNFHELYRVFSIFSKSEFNSNPKERDKTSQSQSVEERNKLEVQLELSKRLLIKLVKTWPGYCLVFGNYMVMHSIINSLNTDVCLLVKKTILEMIRDILDLFDSGDIETFRITSIDGKKYYINKVYYAFIIQGLKSNLFYKTITAFIDKEENPLSSLAKQLRLKFLLLYSKLSNLDILLPMINSSLIGNQGLCDKIDYNPLFSYANGELKYSDSQIINEEDSLIEKDLNNLKLLNIEPIQSSLYTFHKKQLNYMSSSAMSSQIGLLDEELIYNNVKTMDLLDEKFHFNLSRRNIDLNETRENSEAIILARNSIFPRENSKKYSNQYTIEMAKKELYDLVDDNSFISLVKSSNIMGKEPFEWDWKKVDEILEITFFKPELIIELNKLKFFKKLLFFYMPSKNLFTKHTWNTSNFIYCTVGNRIFKLFTLSLETMKILEASPEDNYFSVNRNWFQDFILCFESFINFNKSNNLISDPSPYDNVFNTKNLTHTLTRQVFTFIGILSNTPHGEEFLNKNKFYIYLKQAINENGQSDIVLCLLLENLNLDSQSGISFLSCLFENGSKFIKKYTLLHLKSLLSTGKDIPIGVLNSLISSVSDNEITESLVNILQILINKSNSYEIITYLSPIIESLLYTVNSKSLMYFLMKNDYFINNNQRFMDLISENLTNLNIENEIFEYSNYIDNEIGRIFPCDDGYQTHDGCYMRINLPCTEYQYDQTSEYLWLKQMPFNLSIIISENYNQSNYTTFLSNCSLNYNYTNEKYYLEASINSNNIMLNQQKEAIKFICKLGEKTIDQNTRVIMPGSIISFDYRDFKSGLLIGTSPSVYQIEKDGFIIELTKSDSGVDLILRRVYFYVKILPEKKSAFRPPVNILTQLPNSNIGMSILIKNSYIDSLLEIVEKNSISSNTKIVKAVFWILSLILISKNSILVNEKYSLLQVMNKKFLNCNDYGFKGSICFIFSFISSNNKLLKEELSKLGWTFFKDSDIAFPKKMELLLGNLNDDQVKAVRVEEVDNNEKILYKFTKLSKDQEEIYNSFCVLLNTITHLQGYSKLKEMYKKNNLAFSDWRLVIRVLLLLTKYKFNLQIRQFIFSVLDKTLMNLVVMGKIKTELEALGDRILV